MPDSDDREFIREKIMDKAGGRRYRIRKLIRVVLTAAVFGLVASLFFVLGKKYLEPRFLPEETSLGETISIGRDPDEEAAQTGAESPSESASNSTDTVETDENGDPLPFGADETVPENPSGPDGEAVPEPEDAQAALQEQIAQAADKAVSEELDAREQTLALGWYRQVSRVIKDINKGLVTVSSVTQDTDWFNNPVSKANQSSGAIIYVTDAEVLILADYKAVSEAEALTVTFSGGRTVEARIKKTDAVTGIAIVSVSSGAVSSEVKDSIVTLTLGNSYQIVTGTPLLAAGSPAGYPGSVLTGMVSLVQKNTVGTDTAFQLLYTDAAVSESGGGFLFNMDGELVGVLTRDYGDRETGLSVAIGISCLKGIIETLSSGIDAAYLGIQGQNATAEIAEAHSMPAGIYVTKVMMDSPAYLAGIRAGDIIVGSGSSDLMTTQGLQKFLEDYSTGDVISLTVYRGGQEEYVQMEFSVTLGAR